MSNVRNGNTFYVDATGELTTDKNVLVSSIIVTATGASGTITLSDTVDKGGSAYSPKLKLSVATSGESKQFEFFIRPLQFPNGIRVTTLSNAVASLLITNATKEG